MKHPIFKPTTLAIAMAAIGSMPLQLSAQESENGNFTLEEVIVTGTPGGGELRQLDAAFSITSIDPEDIAKFSPKSTADLFKTIPGVWAESSGGVSGANVFVRGLPSTGDADFLSVALQGVPIYGTSTLSFFEQSTIFRIDETIERVEGLRGGSNTVFSNAQPGLTTNFLLKEGSETPEGLVKLSVGDYGLLRLDAVHSGPLAGGWNYMVGGYVSESDGIRDAGFTSEEGKQLTINITKEFDDGGKISIYNRYTDDFGQWYLPIPVNAVEQIGEDLGTFTQLTDQNRIQVLDAHPTRPAGSTIDLGNGRGWDGNVFGINFSKDVGNVTINNRFNYTKGDNDTYGLVPDGSLGTTLASDVVLPSGVGIVGASVAGGGVVGANDFVGNYGGWIVEKELEALTNDFAVTTELGSHELTFGLYYSDYSADDTWSLGNVRTYVLGGGRVDGVDTVSEFGTGAFALLQSGDAENKAFYIHDKWQITGELSLDVGIRKEDFEAEVVANIFDETRVVDESETTYTAGLNYNLTDSSSVFFRINEGVNFPGFNDIRDNALAVGELSQVEIGYKWQGDNSHVYLTLFDTNLEGAPFAVQSSSGVVNSSVTENEAQGVEIDASYDIGNFSVLLNSTIQSTELVDSSSVEDIGNDAARLPDFQIRITPSYIFDLGESLTGTVYGTISHVDDRFGDQSNLQLLESYTKLDLGLVFNHGENWEYRLIVDNANDEEGFTEGDPRAAGASTSARPILGRSVKASVQYNF